MNESVLPKRSGSRPRTTPTNPHTQLEQNPEREVVDELARRVFALPGVEERTSLIRGAWRTIRRRLGEAPKTYRGGLDPGEQRDDECVVCYARQEEQ